MIRSVILCFFLAAMACDDADDSYSDSILLASAKCGKSPSDMRWLDDIIKESQHDVGLSGNIYAVNVDSKVIFIHQPAVMSCYACIMYDCNGDRIEPTAVDLQKVANAMGPSALIYSPY
ncbi:MAG TPA: hypothetical protein VFT90_05645 [Chryseosolibacter sp.]|nr:hypothetical protein [Chryseosolibacter sp.]